MSNYHRELHSTPGAALDAAAIILVVSTVCGLVSFIRYIIGA